MILFVLKHDEISPWIIEHWESLKKKALWKTNPYVFMCRLIFTCFWHDNQSKALNLFLVSDSCKFLHDRSDYKHGWQLEREMELGTYGQKGMGQFSMQLKCAITLLNVFDNNWVEVEVIVSTNIRLPTSPYSHR